VLCLDMDSMRRWVHELECECSSMKRVIEKMSPRDGGPWRASLALGRKFGCKFKTQVCDSQDLVSLLFLFQLSLCCPFENHFHDF